MNQLEDFIDKHRIDFDSGEPSAGHFDRFESRLPFDRNNMEHEIQVGAPNRFHALKLAAVILLLISVSVIAIEFTTGTLMNRIFQNSEGAVLSKEMSEAFQYYDNRTHEKLSELAKIAKNSPDVRKMQASVIRDLDNLDASTNELKMALKQNPDNERVQAAIIQNQQMKESILNTVLNNVLK